jgi:hypothetical protein
MTPDERRSLANGVWLCQRCAKLVDDDPQQYPVKVLRQWRWDAEERARHRLTYPDAFRPGDRLPLPPPELPDEYTERTRNCDAVVTMLTTDMPGNTTAIVSRLRGVGGYGKTVLAVAVCHDGRVRARYGIYWLDIGRQPDLVASIRSLLRAVSGFDIPLTSLPQARSVLASTLADPDAPPSLVVLDDVWSAADATALIVGAPACHYLVTTRLLDVLPNAGTLVVDQMYGDEALHLLQQAAGLSLGEYVLPLVARLDRWPILLKLVGKVLRHRVESFGDSPTAAVAFVMEEFDRAGIVALDGLAERTEAVGVTLELSLETLPPEERNAALASGIFPEDVPIPLRLLAVAWGVTLPEAQKTAHRLARLGIADLSLSQQTMRLHDIVRDYFTSRLATPEAVHRRLLAGLDRSRALEDPYFAHYCSLHLLGADRIDTLLFLLARAWTVKKLQRSELRASLLVDIDRAWQACLSRPRSTVGRSIALAAVYAESVRRAGSVDLSVQPSFGLSGTLVHPGLVTGWNAVPTAIGLAAAVRDLIRRLRLADDEYATSEQITECLVQYAMRPTGVREAAPLVDLLSHYGPSNFSISRTQQGVALLREALCGALVRTPVRSYGKQATPRDDIWLAGWRALASAALGKVDAALDALDHGVRLLEEDISAWEQPLLCAYLSRIACVIGDRPRTATLARQAVDFPEQTPAGIRALALAQVACIELAQGRQTDALRDARAAIAASQDDLGIGVTRGVRLAARVLAEGGAREEAVAVMATRAALRKKRRYGPGFRGYVVTTLIAAADQGRTDVLDAFARSLKQPLAHALAETVGGTSDGDANRLERAGALIEAVPLPEERLYLVHRLAESRLATGDRKGAAAVLDETRFASWEPRFHIQGTEADYVTAALWARCVDAEAAVDFLLDKSSADFEDINCCVELLAAEHPQLAVRCIDIARNRGFRLDLSGPAHTLWRAGWHNEAKKLLYDMARVDSKAWLRQRLHDCSGFTEAVDLTVLGTKLGIPAEQIPGRRGLATVGSGDVHRLAQHERTPWLLRMVHSRGMDISSLPARARPSGSPVFGAGRTRRPGRAGGRGRLGPEAHRPLFGFVPRP